MVSGFRFTAIPDSRGTVGRDTRISHIALHVERVARRGKPSEHILARSQYDLWPTIRRGVKPDFKGCLPLKWKKSRQVHGNNVLTPPARDPLWKLFLEKFDDPVIRILTIAAVLATGLGIYHEEYVEGLDIVVAVLLATALAFLNEYQAAKEFDILNKVNDEVPVKAVRDGNYQSVPRCDLALVRRLTELHGGSLEVDSEPGKGSRFSKRISWSTIPAIETSSPPVVERLVRQAVVAEDHEITARQLVCYLAEWGVRAINHPSAVGPPRTAGTSRTTRSTRVQGRVREHLARETPRVRKGACLLRNHPPARPHARSTKFSGFTKSS